MTRPRFVPPPVDPAVVSRPAVTDRLREASRLPLTVIVAPPGYGKTTALAEWLAGRPPGVVYVAARRHASDLRGFARSILHAAGERMAALGTSAQALLDEPGDPAPAELAERLADDVAAAGTPVTLVIDDLHEIVDSPSIAFLEALIDAAPPELRLVVASRTDPPLSWARLRLAGRLGEIRAADLGLTVAQSEEVLRRLGTPGAGPRLAELVWSSAEGWPAAVRGIAVALRDLPSPTDRPVLEEAALGAIDDFVAQELIAVLPADLRSQLVRAAVVDEFDHGLLSAILGDAGSGTAGLPFERLVSSFPYLLSDASPEAVRFRPLVRRGLLKELARTRTPAEQSDLRRRAGQWLAGRGMTGRAVRVFIEAGEPDAAADIIEGTMPAVLARQDWRELERWLDAMPRPVIERRPRLMLGRCWVAHLSGRPSPVEDYTARVRAMARPGNPLDDATLATCEVLSFSHVVPIEREPERAAAALGTIASRVPAADRFGAALALTMHSLALQAVGRHADAIAAAEAWAGQQAEQVDAGFVLGYQAMLLVRWWAGQAAGCAEAAGQALALAMPSDLPVAAGWARRGLAMVAYQLDDLPLAEEHFQAGVDDADRLHMLCLADMFAGLAQCHAVGGRIDEALRVLAEGERAAGARRAPQMTPIMQSMGAVIVAASGHGDLARALRLTESVGLDQGPLNLLSHPVANRIRVLLTSSRAEHLAEAEDLIDRYAERAAGASIVPAMRAASVMRASLRLRQGDDRAALEETRAALLLGSAAEFRRTFLDFGPSLLPLLSTLAAEPLAIPGLGPIASAYARQEAMQSGKAVPAWPFSPALALLTMREGQVLDLLAEHLTYKEIAHRLSISPETVKHHVASIYDKLGVSSRREALVRARDLGWNPAA